MCGICGLIDYTGNSEGQDSILRRMCAKLEHRGPDDEGVFISKGRPAASLGHRRLSIIDLSSAGHQPISNEDKTIWLILNGEIYNFQELRVDLLNCGHKFKSDTDTETVVHLYEEYGEDCVKHLRGMFAFAVWDSRKNKLLLARDRVGKKPLLYHYLGGKFTFASEFASLLEAGHIEKKINFKMFDYYLSFGYIPAPFSIYEDVFKLLPGHMLILQDNKVNLKPYWSLDYTKKLKISEEEAKDRALVLLEEAVKIRLYSDVPLGVFLSGGIDSSAVAAVMSRVSSKKIKTFSIGFEDSDYSELKYAKNIAALYGTDHHELIVKPKALEVLPILAYHYGEPYADSSAVPTYYVSRETKRYVTVALNGDGGDESFAGYERYHAMLLAERLNHLPSLAKGFLRGAIGLLPDSVEPKNKSRRIKRFIEGAFLPATQRYARWVGIFDQRLKKELYSDSFLKSIGPMNTENLIEPFLNSTNCNHLVDCLLNTDVHTYLPEDLLVKVDIASMANSLECRSPFLDHKLMEFAASLPVEYKLKGGVKKYILKKAIEDIVPKENIYRKKMGFGIPVGRWFRTELKDYIQDMLLGEESVKRGYFKPEIVRRLVKDQVEGRKDNSFTVWSLLMLELWHKNFID